MRQENVECLQAIQPLCSPSLQAYKRGGEKRSATLSIFPLYRLLWGQTLNLPKLVCAVRINIVYELRKSVLYRGVGFESTNTVSTRENIIIVLSQFTPKFAQQKFVWKISRNKQAEISKDIHLMWFVSYTVFLFENRHTLYAKQRSIVFQKLLKKNKYCLAETEYQSKS